MGLSTLVRVKRARRTRDTASALLLLTVTSCVGPPADNSPSDPATPPPISTDGSVSVTAPASAGPVAASTATPSRTIPPEARVRTAAGAEAFVRHFIEVYNDSAMSTTAGRLPQLATPACGSCEALEAGLVEVQQAQGRYDRHPVEITLIFGMSGVAERDPTYQVMARIHELPNRILYPRRSPELVDEATTDFIYTLTWISGTWRVHKIWARRDVP